MLSEIYIEALLVDEELADQVWGAWNAGEIDDQIACRAWVLMVERPLYTQERPLGCYDGDRPLTTQSGHRAALAKGLAILPDSQCRM